MPGLIQRIQHKYWRFGPDPNLRKLYMMRVIRDLVHTITIFFLPIFLYQYGSELELLRGYGLSTVQRGMLLIGGYYLVMRLIMVVVGIPAGQIARKLGLTKTLLLAHSMRLFAFVGLLLATQNVGYLVLSVVAEAFHTALFWPSYLTVLTEKTSFKSMSRDLGLLQFFLQLTAVIAPASSGYLAAHFGFEVLFLLAIICTLVGGGILLLMDIDALHDVVSWKEFREWVKERSFLRLTASFAGRYLYDSVLHIWPLYVFLVLGSIDRVGYLYTASLFLTMLVVFFAGLYMESSKPNKTFFLSGGMLMSFWFLRVNLFSVWGIALVDAAERLLGGGFWLFYDVIMVKRARGSQAFSYYVYRELVISIIAVLFWAAFAAFFFFSQGWNALFVVAGLGVLLSLLIREHHHRL